MMILKSGTEFVTAIIDLITGLILIVPSIWLYKSKWEEKTLKNGWTGTLTLLSVGNILGAIAHGFTWSEFIFDCIWVVLYPVMFFLVAVFGLLAVADAMKLKKIEGRNTVTFLLFTLIVSTVATVYGFFTVSDIRIFVYFASIIALPSFFAICIVGLKRKWKSGLYMLAALIPQLVGLPFQIVSKGTLTCVVTFDHNGIYHLCLLASVVLMIIAAASDRNKKFQ